MCAYLNQNSSSRNEFMFITGLQGAHTARAVRSEYLPQGYQPKMRIEYVHAEYDRVDRPSVCPEFLHLTVVERTTVRTTIRVVMVNNANVPSTQIIVLYLLVPKYTATSTIWYFRTITLKSIHIDKRLVPIPIPLEKMELNVIAFVSSNKERI